MLGGRELGEVAGAEDDALGVGGSQEGGEEGGIEELEERRVSSLDASGLHGENVPGEEWRAAAARGGGEHVRGGWEQVARTLGA